MTSTFAPVPSGGVRSPASLPFCSRVTAAETAHNPLLDAAQVLLQALADTPAQLDGDAIGFRRKWLAHEVRLFEKLCEEIHVRPDHVQNARYCLCAALDEAAMQTGWGNGVTTGAEWSTNGLAAIFSGDRRGGDGVYRIIAQTMHHPYEHVDLIEVIQNILDLGFQGRYRFEAGGQDKLRTIRQQVHEAVVTNGRRTDGRRALLRRPGSRLRGQFEPWDRPTATRKACAWIVMGVLGGVLLGASGYFFHERLTRDTGLKQVGPAVDTLARNLRAILKDEIAAGTLSFEENLLRTGFTLRFNDMFAPGEPAVNAWVGPLIATVGREIARVPCKVQVTGYTDSLPVSTPKRASNLALSEARARQVMQILLASGVPAERIEATGKGAADPVAGNETRQDRAKNRRVEIAVVE